MQVKQDGCSSEKLVQSRAVAAGVRALEERSIRFATDLRHFLSAMTMGTEMKVEDLPSCLCVCHAAFVRQDIFACAFATTHEYASQLDCIVQSS